MFTEKWESKHVPFSSTIRGSQETRVHFSRSSMAEQSRMLHGHLELEVARSLIVCIQELVLYEEFKSQQKASLKAKV